MRRPARGSPASYKRIRFARDPWYHDVDADPWQVAHTIADDLEATPVGNQFLQVCITAGEARVFDELAEIQDTLKIYQRDREREGKSLIQNYLGHEKLHR